MRRSALGLMLALAVACANGAGTTDPLTPTQGMPPSTERYQVRECHWSQGVLRFSLLVGLGSVSLPSETSLTIAAAEFEARVAGRPLNVEVLSVQPLPGQADAQFELSISQIPDQLVLTHLDLFLTGQSSITGSDLDSLSLLQPLKLGIVTIEAANPERVEGNLVWTLTSHHPELQVLNAGAVTVEVSDRTFPVSSVVAGEKPQRMALLISELPDTEGPARLEIAGWALLGKPHTFALTESGWETCRS